MPQFIHRFHKAIVVIALVLTVLSIGAALRLKLNVSLFSLLPSNRPEVQRFFEITEAIGFQSLLISVVEVDETPALPTVIDFMDALAKGYADIPVISKVDYQRSPQRLLKMFDTLLTHMPVLLTPENLAMLSKKLTDEHIEKTIRENRQILMTPLATAAKQMIMLDPLGVGELLFASIRLPFMKKSGPHENGLYRTKDKRTYFMFLTPTEPPQNIDFSKDLMQQINAIEAQVLEDVSTRFEFSQTDIRIRHTGGYPIAVQDEAITRLDIKITLITSLVCVLLLFFISFRTPGVLFLVSIPLFASLIWTIGFAGIFFQHLNILTGLFACVLIGLGIDFAIHIVNRFFDPHVMDLDALSRLTYTFKEAGMGILVGGVTTAMAFFAVGLSDFKGFRELGLLTGFGILFCLMAMLLLLPAALVWISSLGWFHKKTVLSGFFLAPLLKTIRKFPAPTLIVLAMVVGVLAFVGFQVKFDDNLKNFRPSNSSVLQLQDKVTSWLGGSSGTVLLTITGSSQEAVMNQEAVIAQSLRSLQEEGDIAKIISISHLLPPPGRQRKNIEWIQSHPNEFDSQRIQNRLERALTKYGFRFSQGIQHYIDQLGRGFARDSVLLPSHLNSPDIGPDLKRFFFQKDDRFTAIIYIHPSRDLWLYKDTSRFKTRLVQSLTQAGIDPGGYDLTGANLLTGQLKGLILQNLKVSLILAASSILAILWFYFRKLRYLFYAILPLVSGLSVLMGMMVLLSIEFNFLNIMVIPMIIGIGIDDGVHFTNTLRYPDDGSSLNGLFQTGRAVVLTSLTTIAGFGSIILSHYPGLKSMGTVAVIGIAGCLLSSIIIMPAIFFASKKINGK